MSLTVMPDRREQDAITKLHMVLRPDVTHPELVGPGGERIALPDSIYQILRDVVRLLASNTPVTLAPADHELTTQQAAHLLNVSRPYLVKLLESGEIPFHRVGSHRRVRLQDLLQYRQRRDEARTQALDELTGLSDELGLYE